MGQWVRMPALERYSREVLFQGLHLLAASAGIKSQTELIPVLQVIAPAHWVAEGQRNNVSEVPRKVLAL